MPEMSIQERLLCRSLPWRWFARRVVLPWALQGQSLSGEVLELGSGSGAMAAEILRRFPDVRITATDYDERMVERAAAELAGFGPRARTMRADAAALPFAEGSFDAVVSFLMLHHVGDWERAFRESARVLRAGGRLTGYDLLSARATEGIHRMTRDHGERLIRWNDLTRVLRELPAAEARARRSGLLVRFEVTKAGAAFEAG